MHKKSRQIVSMLSFASVVVSVYGIANAENNTVTSEPNVPFKFSVGVKKYHESCASCHGKWLQGTNSGPPLLHGFYKPSHHNDASFYRAALNGVTAHHWNFGNMPRIEGITTEDMDKIVPFIRWLQQERGLF